jgi:hypothetical protein
MFIGRIGIKFSLVTSETLGSKETPVTSMTPGILNSEIETDDGLTTSGLEQEREIPVSNSENMSIK